MKMKRIFTFLNFRFFICLLFALALFAPGTSTAQCGTLTAIITTTESRCASTGTIGISATGGVAPQTYQYRITDGPVTSAYTSSNIFSGLPPGTYTVRIKDITANCYIEKINIILPGNYIAPGIFYNSTKPTCMNGSDGTIFVTSQPGGRAPFSYKLIAPSPSQVGTVSTNGTFTGLIPGLYYIQMTDSCGGIQTRNQLVNNYSWSILNTSNVTESSCQNLTVNVYLTNNNGINSPNAVYTGFQYGISRFPGDTTWYSSSPFTYNIGKFRSATIVVKDNCGNPVQTFSWTDQKPKVSANVSTTNLSCSTFTATVTGQQNLNSAFTQYCLYDLTNTTPIVPCQSSPVFNNLSYGSYTIRIKETCYDTTILRTVSETKPIPSVNNNPQINYFCNLFNATITGQTDIGNTATYCLYINGNPIADTCNSTGIFTDLTYGQSYCIKLHNNVVCFDTLITRCFTINKQKPSVSNSVNISNLTCSTFTATVQGLSNVTNPIYRLYNSANNTQIGIDQTSPVFNLLPYGSYCVRLINDPACYDTTILRCFTELAPVVNISLSAQKTCALIGGTDIKVTCNSGVAPYALALYSPTGVLLNTDTMLGYNYTFYNMPGLPTGAYYSVICTDACGRKDTATVSSNVYYINTDVIKITRCPSGTNPNGTGDVNVDVSENRGGTFTTTIIKKNGVAFNQNPDTTINSGNFHTYNFIGLIPATYIFKTHSNSCNADIYDTVTVPAYAYPGLSNSAGYICDNGLQSISSATTNGAPPYQYQIFGSVTATPSINTAFQSSPIFNINNGTTYSLIRLRVLDACLNASINDVGFVPVATPIIQSSNNCLLSPTVLSVDSVPNAVYFWYKRTYNPIDSILVGPGSAYTIPFLTVTDTGTYICRTVINSGCAVRVSYMPVTGICTNNPLPIKLESFTANPQSNNVLLNWVVSEEINVSKYEIQYSINGVNFETIGSLLAKNSHSYNFIHSNPVIGFNYYRLKTIDKDGKVNYSDIRKVNFGKGSSISIYPNPTTNVINITFTNSIINKPALITLLTIDGRVLYQKNIKSLSQAETIDLGKFSKGKYILQLVSENDVITKSIEIIK
jgi:hypothetical protein